MVNLTTADLWTLKFGMATATIVIACLFICGLEEIDRLYRCMRINGKICMQKRIAKEQD
jgi:hypothetical protein